MANYRFEKLSPRLLLHADGALEGTIQSEFFDQPVMTSEAILSAGHNSPSDHGGAAIENEDHSHTDDPVRAGEHQALLDLVPHEQATHTAITDGAWSDAATWENGELPASQAHVLVPHGVTVTIDEEFSQRIATIRVDGILGFATEENTALTVDTLVVSEEGTLHIGTSADPIAENVTAQILFTDGGQIDSDWDPTLLSRGLISHGSVTIHGAVKTGHVDLATAPEKGDEEIELASAAEGWRVGDRILIPGVVRPTETNRGRTLVDEDEIVVITEISEDGLQISFEGALRYDHVPPQTYLTLPVANLNRNIQFSSENTTDPQRAGHVMFMHSSDSSVNYASFKSIGRNDKSQATTDPELDDDGKLIPGTGLNPRGRYAVHFHRMGSESEAATVTGSVVENSPGWGFVNHDSNVIMRGNVSYNVKGAGFVAEVGNERGAFIGNFAQRSTGKNFYHPQGPSDKGEGTGFGSAGHGFWLQSPGVALINNIAAGHAQEGIFIHSRTITEANRQLPTYTSLIDMPAGTPLEFAPGADEPSIRAGLVRPDQAPLAEVSGNKVFASGAGIGVRWRRQSSARAEGSDGDVIEDFEIWNVRWAGIHLGYVSGLTFRNGLILGDLEDPLSLSNREQSHRQTETAEFHSAPGKGFAANRNSRDITLESVEIGGFSVGIQALTQGHTSIDRAFLHNVENLLIVTPQATSQSEGQRRIDATNIVNIPLSPQALEGKTPYNVRLLKQLDRAPVAGGSSNTQEWDAFTAQDEIYYNGHRLYFHDQAADAVPFDSDGVPAFLRGPAYAEFLDLTNQELLDEHDLALSGAVAPEEAFDGLATLGVNALALELDEVPSAAARATVRFDASENEPTWTLGANLQPLNWQTRGLDAEMQWHVYLVGENGSQEIARTGLPSEYANVQAGEVTEGWQHWEFQWPEVGELPPWWQGTVEPGEYSLITVSGISPAIYLGQVHVVVASPPLLSEVDHFSMNSEDEALLPTLDRPTLVRSGISLPEHLDLAYDRPMSSLLAISVEEIAEPQPGPNELATLVESYFTEL